jgi:hypothetical protein
MPFELILKIAISALVGLAFISNLILYTALRSNDVRVEFMRSVKPGYLENLYRQTPSLKSPFLSFTSFVCTFSKIAFALIAIAMVLWSAVNKAG